MARKGAKVVTLGPSFPPARSPRKVIKGRKRKVIKECFFVFFIFLQIKLL